MPLQVSGTVHTEQRQREGGDTPVPHLSIPLPSCMSWGIASEPPTLRPAGTTAPPVLLRPELRVNQTPALPGLQLQWADCEVHQPPRLQEPISVSEALI